MLLPRIYKVVLSMLVVVSFVGCKPGNIQLQDTPTPENTATHVQASPTQPAPTNTIIPTETPTPSNTPTPVWVFQSGSITCPILLYHRIADPPSIYTSDARYYIPPSEFEWQMQTLRDWGYTTIQISLLTEAIIRGAALPPRPVVISFDDGDASVFENAFPIMQSQGFTGLIYLVGNYLGATGYMDIPKVQALVASGWEIGSHSMSHPHLPSVPEQVYYEAAYSKDLLQNTFGVNVSSFAYPFGEIDPFVATKVAEYGYSAAVGLGTTSLHGLDSLYYLSRIEVRYGTDLAAFTTLLPWSGRP